MPNPMTELKKITIASRASPLAMVQARAVRSMLAELDGLTAYEAEARYPILSMTSSGDKNLASSLAEAGGKGLFTKEIEEAVLSGAADLAVHSMKDMPAELPEGLIIGAIPKRENPADSFISKIAKTIRELPKKAVVGTASVRRRAQLLHRRPDLQIVPLRGNVGTRLKKLAKGEVAATFLAEAGLQRLGLDLLSRTVLDPKEHLPALAQGALCLEIRGDDIALKSRLKALTCRATSLAIALERGFLARLDGSCQTPMAGLAQLEGDEISFRAEILSLDGRERKGISKTIAVPDGTDLEQQMSTLADHGAGMAEELLAQLSPALRAAIGLK